MRRAPALASLVVVGLTATLAGCASGTGGDAEGDQTITFIGPRSSDDTEALFDELAAQFEADNPGVTVDVEIVPWNDINTKVNTLVATGQQPDVLYLDTFSQFAADGMLLPASEYLSSDVLDDFVPALTEGGFFEGTQYALPAAASVRSLVYNKDIFEEAGIEAPPTTWDEFLAASQKITDAGKIGYLLPFGPPEAYVEYSLWMWNNGGQWMDGDTWTIDTPEGAEALEFLKKVSDAGLTQQSPATTPSTDVATLFARGDVGMLMGGSWLPGTLESLDADIDLGVAAPPVADASMKPTTMAVVDSMMAFDTDTDPELIGQFLTFLYAPEQYTRIAADAQSIPTTQSAAKELGADSLLTPFLPFLDSAEFYPNTQAAWPDIMAESVETLGTVLTGASTPQAVLEALQRTAEDASAR